MEIVLSPSAIIADLLQWAERAPLAGWRVERSFPRQLLRSPSPHNFITVESERSHLIYEVEGFADSAGYLHPDAGRPSDVESTTGILVHAYEPDRNGEPKEGTEHWFWEFYPEGSTWDEIDVWVDMDYGEYEHAQT